MPDRAPLWFPVRERLGDPLGEPATPEAPDDAEVVARIVAGEREAYEFLVRRYQEPLFRFALGMTGSPDAAADLVQDTLVKGFTSLKACREPRRFGAWIHRILRNRCLDYLKRNRRHVPVERAALVSAPEIGADLEVHRDEIRTALFAALTELPDAQREAFLLKHLEERSYEEMADQLGASVSALKMRVKRAREALQAVLVGRLVP
jgi:RNA polymerase sigma-70 factor, ECF subfamily